jgi:hypothetical protein
MTTKKTSWPIYQYEECKDTIFLLHQWTRMVGNIRLKNSPWLNQTKDLSLYIDTQGLSTRPIPYEGGIFEIKFDFHRHELKIKTSFGTRERFALGGHNVASFNQQLLEKLSFLSIDAFIPDSANSITEPILYPTNPNRILYHAFQAQKLWKVMIQAHSIFTIFQSRFLGKSSPIHIIWGSFDLSYSRFSGRKIQEFSEENLRDQNHDWDQTSTLERFTVGFWPGNDLYPSPCFYASVHPFDPGYETDNLKPSEAFWSKELGKFILPYAIVQKSAIPHETLLSFLQSTYDHVATLGKWEREHLDVEFYSIE